jgi:hypothetical protein
MSFPYKKEWTVYGIAMWVRLSRLPILYVRPESLTYIME